MKDHYIAFIIGNSSTREDFDANTLKGRGALFGCNYAIYDIHLDYAVCIDEQMRKEIYASSNLWRNRRTQIVTTYFDHPAIFVDDEPIGKTYGPNGWDSGRLAVLTALNLYPHLKLIYLIGIDFYNPTDKPRNMYLDKPANQGLTVENQSPPKWAEIWNSIFAAWDKISFYRVGPLQEGYDKLKMVKFISYQQLEKEIYYE